MYGDYRLITQLLGHKSYHTVPLKRWPSLTLTFYQACSIWVDWATCSSLHKIEHFCALCLKVITIEHREGKHSKLCNLPEVSWSTWMLHAWQKANKTDIAFECHCTYTHQPNMLKLHGLLSRPSCSLPASVNIDFAHIGKGMILWFSLLYQHQSLN